MLVAFEAGAIFGACLTVTLLLLFMVVFGQEEPPRDDEWNPWGGDRRGR